MKKVGRTVKATSVEIKKKIQEVMFANFLRHCIVLWQRTLRSTLNVTWVMLDKSVSRRHFITETRARFQASLRGILGVQNNNGTGFSDRTSVSPSLSFHQRHSSYFIHLLSTRYYLSNWQRQQIKQFCRFELNLPKYVGSNTKQWVVFVIIKELSKSHPKYRKCGLWNTQEGW